MSNLLNQIEVAENLATSPIVNARRVNEKIRVELANGFYFLARKSGGSKYSFVDVIPYPWSKEGNPKKWFTVRRASTKSANIEATQSVTITVWLSSKVTA